MNSLFDKINPVKTLGINLSGYARGRLELTAPLQPNVNDKGTAFAGSISSMLVLSGWGAVTLCLEEAGIHADVMAVESNTRYRRPACAEMKCVAELGDTTQLMADLGIKKRGRIQIESNLYSDGELCATMTTSYAVFAKPVNNSEH